MLLLGNVYMYEVQCCIYTCTRITTKHSCHTLTPSTYMLKRFYPLPPSGNTMYRRFIDAWISDASIHGTYMKWCNWNLQPNNEICRWGYIHVQTVLTRTYLMCHTVTLDRTTAKLIVCSHSEDVRKPRSKGGYVEVCLIEASQVSIWNIQFSCKYTLDCSHDDLCELQASSVCVAPADCDHTTRGSGRSGTDRSRDWGQREKQSC